MLVHNTFDYITWNLPPIDFLIDPILPDMGNILIFGEPGSMKTYLSVYMGCCLATGNEFLGMLVKQCRVLLANFEMSERGYHRRLVKTASHFDGTDQLLHDWTKKYFFLTDEHNYNEFAAMVRGVQPKHGILDCFTNFYGGESENNNTEVARFCKKLNDITEETGCSFTIVHHSNKNELYASAMSRSRGATSLLGWADTVIHIAKQPNGRQLQFLKVREAEGELPSMNIRFEDGLWVRR